MLNFDIVIQDWIKSIERHVRLYNLEKEKDLTIEQWLRKHTLSVQNFKNWKNKDIRPNKATINEINKIIAEEKGEIERAKNV